MDPVYQDELILGFQSMIDDKWSWGVRGIYRKLNNAIDDMEITVHRHPCNGEPNRQSASSWVIRATRSRSLPIPTATARRAKATTTRSSPSTLSKRRLGACSTQQRQRTYLGVVSGFPEPKRDYKALEFVLDRAWDDRWALNASYTLSFSKGNAEGPVNSDSNFADAGRTEAFDDPWVNFGGDGYLANDRRHQVKLRGSYGLGEHWRFGASLNAASGRPISAFGVGNPFDGTVVPQLLRSSRPTAPRRWDSACTSCTRAATEGRTPWIFDLGAERDATSTRSRWQTCR